MKYVESKERSAELLRQTLAHMGSHDAAFNPVTYTLWYEFAAGINPRLTEALSRATDKARRLGDAAVDQLYRDHVAPADDATMSRIGNEMQRVLRSLAQSASHTGDRAGSFGDQLGALATTLASNDVAAISRHLGEVLRETAEMQASIEALRVQVTTSQDEIGQLRGELERARCEALLDPLSGILSRKGFDQKLAQIVAAPVPDGPPHCLVMLDIDHFKSVNDKHGHVVGDRVIQAVGEILRSALTDPAHAAARYGGEEFALLLPCTPLERGQQLAEDIRARTKALKIRNRKTQEVILTVTISGGITRLEHDDDASSFVSRADAALYQSKKRGRDCVTRA